MTEQTLSLYDRIIQVRGGARVERCHAIPHFTTYNNAMHQWGVAHLCHAFWPESPNLVAAALFHDIPEAWVGDIVSPLLRYNPDIREKVGKYEKGIFDSLKIPNENDLLPGDYAKLKAADRLEFLLWCMDQIRLGNQEVEEGLREVIIYLDANPLPSPAQEFYRELRVREYRGHRASGVIKEIADDLR
jgi:5'-deoxynucleotidase YfbR-like HD superfamily hydrolase